MLGRYNNNNNKYIDVEISIDILLTF
jgi:hypothetical protein